MRLSYLLRLLPFIRMKPDSPGLPLEYNGVQSNVCTLVYNDYWTLDKYRLYNLSKHVDTVETIYRPMATDPTHLEKIHYTLDQLGPNHRRIYFMRYDSKTLFMRHRVRTICKEVGITPQRYYAWMREIRDHLQKNKQRPWGCKAVKIKHRPSPKHPLYVQIHHITYDQGENSGMYNKPKKCGATVFLCNRSNNLGQ